MDDFLSIPFQINKNTINVQVSVLSKVVYLPISDLCILFGVSKSYIFKILKDLHSSKSKNSDLFGQNSDQLVYQLKYLDNKGKTHTSKHYSYQIISYIGERLKTKIHSIMNKFVQNYLDNLNKGISSKIIIYNNGNLSLNVEISPNEDTVWLNVYQIASLFETSTDNVYLHIKNIYDDEEVVDTSTEESSVDLPSHKRVPNLLPDGRSFLMDFYNLDVILSVGYRVKSKRAIEFRRWASKVLKEYLINGYALDEQRIVSARNIIRIENEIQNIKEQVQDIKENLFVVPSKERIFFEGEYFDAISFISGLFQTATKSIVLVDPYFDIDGLVFFTNVGDVSKTIYISSYAKINKAEIDGFEKQYGPISINIDDSFHDRILIIDNTDCYAIGTSLNHLGNKMFFVFKLVNKKVIDKVLSRINK